MPRRKSGLRYVVTGPGIDPDEPPSYADAGPTLSRALTAACASKEDGTWYARDAVTDEILGYCEREGKLVFTRRNSGARG